LLEILSFRLPKNKTPVSSTEKSQKPSQMYISFRFIFWTRVFSDDNEFFFRNSPRETSSEMKNLESPTT
jgi:hypothetical protein